MLKNRTIVMIGEYPPSAKGGKSFHLKNLSKILVSDNNIIVITGGNESKSWEDNGVRVFEEKSHLKVPTSFQKLFRAKKSHLNITLFQKLFRANAFRKQVDIYHAHSAFEDVWAGYVNRGLPIVTTVHGITLLELMVNKKITQNSIKYRMVKYFEKKGFELSDFIICVHRELYDWLREEYRVPDNKMVIIPNGVDPEIFRPDPEGREKVRRRLGISDNEILITCFKTHQKDDFERVIRAVAKMKGEHIRLLMPWRERHIPMRKIASSMGVEDMVTVDFIPSGETPAYYSASDIVAIPYLKKGYMFGGLKMFEANPGSLKEMCKKGYASSTSLTAMEAFACGRPTIIGVPNAKMRLSGDDIGVPVPAWDPDSLAEAIGYLIEERELREKMGENAREFIKRHFTWERVAEKTSEVYEKVLNL